MLIAWNFYLYSSYKTAFKWYSRSMVWTSFFEVTNPVSHLMGSLGYRVYANMSIKWTTWYNARISGAPLHIKAPLVAVWQLIHYLQRKTLLKLNPLPLSASSQPTSPVRWSECGFQHKTLLSLPQLSSRPESWGHQAKERIPLQVIVTKLKFLYSNSLKLS